MKILNGHFGHGSMAMVRPGERAWACCGALFHESVNAFNTDNVGITFLLKPKGEIDEIRKQVPKEDGSFKYDEIDLDTHVMFVKYRLPCEI